MTEGNDNPYSVSPASIEGGDRKGTDGGNQGPSGPRPTDALYSPRQIFFGAFLGGPLAAAWLMSRNYLVLEDTERAKQTLWLGPLVTLLVLMVAFMMPPEVPNAVWPIAYSLGIYYYAIQQFAEITQQHYAAGGLKQSWWRVAGAGVASVVIIMVAIVLFASLFPSLFS
jgi:hypothetical protein